jgi:phenylalanyl-tRNA synthetase beta chain
MKISLNTIRGFNQRYGCTEDIAPDGVAALVERIGTQLGAVEEVADFGKKYEGIIVAKVVACVKHPNADKLKVCKIDDGGAIQDIKRDKNGHVQVVCGAPNAREGLLVAWLPPGTTVLSTADKEPFVLEAREIRGEVSNGMLASPKELALGDNHDGILEVDTEVKPGTAFADAYNVRDDAVIDIENKMFTHRPDCFGFLGVARELAGIQDMAFKSPDWYTPNPEFPAVEGEPLHLAVTNELSNLVPRFTAVVMRDVKVGPSPVWLQIELAKVGQKSINNIVDYTNFFMLETGQPLHAYDYDKVKRLSAGEGASIIVRKPKTGEKIKLLNGKEIEPWAEAIIIATDQQAIGLGGVMGGSQTEVDQDTTNIILESATFDMYATRRTAMTHGLFTDAVTRFTKGQSPLQNLAVLHRIMEEIRTAAGGQIARGVIDYNNLAPDMQRWQSLYPPISITPEFINNRLGVSLKADEVKSLLENVEFRVAAQGQELTVTAPFWRTDIELREDVVEEVGRLYGFDKLPLVLQQRDLTPAIKDPLLTLKATIRATLAKAGANEVLTYSFVHGGLLDRTGQDRTKAFEISNALSPDLQYYRLSLTPSLLEKVHPNVKAGYDQFALFELGKAHSYGEQDAFEPDVPKEVNALSFVYTAKRPHPGAAYYWARHQLLNLLAAFRVADIVKLQPLPGADLYKNSWIEQLARPFEPERAAALRDTAGLIWGVVGEFRPTVRRQLKLPEFTSGFEIDPLLLLQRSSANTAQGYVPLSRFPKVRQDITLKVSADVPYQELFDFVWKELGKVQPDNALPSLSPLDIYQSANDSAHKNVTLRLGIVSYDRTLTDSEVNNLLDHVAAAAKTKLGAERV